VATAAADAILASVGATTVGGVYASDVRIVRAPSGAMDVLNAQPTVEYAERDVAYRLLLSDPNDPRFDDQYAHRRISSVAGWASYPGSYTASGGATIAILDTGVDTDHPDLAGRIDTVNSTCTLGLLFCLFGIQDDHGHGTHVAGIAGAATNNGTGVAGVAFNAKLQIVKVCNAAGSCSLSAVASGINWARTHGAKVISMSLGGPSGSTTLRNAVQQADAAGAVIVAAAGNDGDPTLNYPAAYDEVISVASTTSSDSRSSFSNRRNLRDALGDLDGHAPRVRARRPAVRPEPVVDEHPGAHPDGVLRRRPRGPGPRPVLRVRPDQPGPDAGILLTGSRDPRQPVRQVGVEALRDRDLAGRRLEVLQDRDDRPADREGRPVERVDEPPPALGRHADVEPAGLVVGAVRT
jgi:thermitase